VLRDFIREITNKKNSGYKINPNNKYPHHLLDDIKALESRKYNMQEISAEGSLVIKSKKIPNKLKQKQSRII